MAVLDHVPGLEVQIVSEGNPLPEYADFDVPPKANVVCNYIEARSGEKFEVLIKFHDNFKASYGCKIAVRLDGIDTNRRNITLERLKKWGGHKIKGPASRIHGEWYAQNFTFSPFLVEELCEQAVNSNTSDKLRQAGILTIMLFRSENKSRPSHSSSQMKDIKRNLSDFNVVPEKKIQAHGLSHYGGVGGQPTKMGSRTYSFNYVDGKADENAFAIFEFKYRSLAMLKALRVIPDDSKVTPQPQPTRVEHSRATPAIEKTIPMGVNHSHSSGLSNAELIAIIGTYREHTSGLSGLNGKELAAVLEYYRNSDSQPRTIKREADDDADMVGSRKRQRREIIVIDD